MVLNFDWDHFDKFVFQLLPCHQDLENSCHIDLDHSNSDVGSESVDTLEAESHTTDDFQVVHICSPGMHHLRLLVQHIRAVVVARLMMHFLA